MAFAAEGLYRSRFNHMWKILTFGSLNLELVYRFRQPDLYLPLLLTVDD